MLNKATFATGMGSMALMVAGVLLANKEIIPARVGMLFFVLAGLVGIVAIGCAAAVALRTHAFHISLIGVLGALPLMAVATAGIEGLRYPPINDISTDLEEPPAFVHAVTLPENAGRDMTFPQKWAGIIRKAERYKDLAPARVARPAPDVFETALRQAQQTKNWEVTYSDPASGVIEAVAETPMLKFRDDVIIRVRPDGDGAARVDMRSKSREGRSDLGANAKRIRAFLEKVR